jgi:hypothetical protein
MQGAPARRFLQLGSKNDAKPTGENGCALNVQLANPLAEAIEAPRKRGRCVATHWPREAKRVVSAASLPSASANTRAAKRLAATCCANATGKRAEARNPEITSPKPSYWLGHNIWGWILPQDIGAQLPNCPIASVRIAGPISGNWVPIERG